MKKIYKLSTLVILVLCFNLPTAFAQATLNEKGFSFQGYARNTDGAALSSTAIEVQFTIYPDGGSAVFTENHTGVTTDAFGVFHLIIGSISTATYKALDFAINNDYFLKVETKVVGGTFATISDAEMQSVPYAQAADNGVPVGSVIIFVGPKANIPSGWLACDGAAVSSTTYPKLFSAIGTSWGANGGDFNVPDMRGYFIRGVSGTTGTTRDPEANTRTAIQPGGITGNDVGSYQGDGFENHTHLVDPPLTNTNLAGTHTHTQRLGDGGTGTSLAAPTDGGGFFDRTGTILADGAHTHFTDISAFSSGNPNSGNFITETRTKNVHVWYIIRAR